MYDLNLIYYQNKTIMGSSKYNDTYVKYPN